MLRCKDEEKKALEMIEGDFGLILPFELDVEEAGAITEIDSFSIKIYTEINGEPLVEKTYSKQYIW